MKLWTGSESDCEGAVLPDGMGEVNTLPGFYRKSVQLQDRVSLMETRLMSWTSYKQMTSKIRLSSVLSIMTSQPIREHLDHMTLHLLKLVTDSWKRNVMQECNIMTLSVTDGNWILTQQLQVVFSPHTWHVTHMFPQQSLCFYSLDQLHSTATLRITCLGVTYFKTARIRVYCIYFLNSYLSAWLCSACCVNILGVLCAVLVLLVDLIITNCPVSSNCQLVSYITLYSV